MYDYDIYSTTSKTSKQSNSNTGSKVVSSAKQKSITNSQNNLTEKDKTKLVIVGGTVLLALSLLFGGLMSRNAHAKGEDSFSAAIEGTATPLSDFDVKEMMLDGLSQEDGEYRQLLELVMRQYIEEYVEGNELATKEVIDEITRNYIEEALAGTEGVSDEQKSYVLKAVEKAIGQIDYTDIEDKMKDYVKNSEDGTKKTQESMEKELTAMVSNKASDAVMQAVKNATDTAAKYTDQKVADGVADVTATLDSKLQKNMSETTKQTESKISSLKSQMTQETESKINAIKAQVDNETEAKLMAIKQTATGLDEKIKAMGEANKAIEGQINNARVDFNSQMAAIQASGAATDEKVAAIREAAKEYDEKIRMLRAANAKYEDDIAEIKQNADLYEQKFIALKNNYDAKLADIYSGNESQDEKLKRIDDLNTLFKTQLTEIEKSQNDLGVILSAYSDKFSSADGRISENAAAINTLSDKADENATAINTLSGKADNNAAAINALSGKADNNAAAINALSGKADNSAAAINALSGKADNNAAAISALSGKADNNATAISGLSGRLNDYSKEVSSVLGRVGNVESSLSTVSNQVNAIQNKIDSGALQGSKVYVGSTAPTDTQGLWVFP